METENSKLSNFPRVYYVSLEESVDRQNSITEQFSNYGIVPHPIISKRFLDCDDKVEGKYSHQLNDGTKGCCVSHLKAIKDWYDNYDQENYAFFCEDDLSLETVKYWNFTWEEFIESIPEDADCVQLLTIRKDFGDFKIRERYWNDWGATAYIITRDHAKKLIDHYIKGDVYCLEIPNSDIMPLIENILFTSFGKCYTIPLFVENTLFNSTYTTEQDSDVKDGQKSNHYHASEIVLNYWKSNFIETTDTIDIINLNKDEELSTLINDYSLDTENPIKNFNIGVWYENNGHTAPALSYYLRCAERSEDLDLAYEALIRGSYCYDKQGTRDGTAKSLLQQALCLLPNRPEAYFLLSRFSERREWWQDSYIYADWGLQFADFNLKPLHTDVEYPGYYGLLFEKAVSGWWWGKELESKNIFLDLKENYPLNPAYRQSVNDNLVRIGVNLEEEQETQLEEIPVIGVAIVNGINWLERLIESIDYPVKDLFIVNNNGRGQITDQLDEIAKRTYTYIQNVRVCHLPSNIGCPSAWNLIIKSYINAPYWVIASHDIAFTPGLLKEMVEKTKEQNIGVIKPTEFQWDLVLIKDWVVERCGLFDENFYPAYLEDCDYYIRLLNENISIGITKNQPLHGDKGYELSGSQTWRTEPDIADKIHSAHNSNFYYIAEKWGPNWRDNNWNYDPWKSPYNKEDIPISYTKFDLKFCRMKYIGF